MHTATGAMWPTWRRVHDPQRRLTPHGIRCGIGNLWNSCADLQRLVMARFLRHWLKYHHNTIIGTMHIQVVESVNFWKVNIVWTDCWFLILHFSEFQCCAQANLSLDWKHLIHLFDMHMEGVYCFLAPAAVSTCSVIFWERQFLCLTLHVPTTSIFELEFCKWRHFFRPDHIYPMSSSCLLLQILWYPQVFNGIDTWCSCMIKGLQFVAVTIEVWVKLTPTQVTPLTQPGREKCRHGERHFWSRSLSLHQRRM